MRGLHDMPFDLDKAKLNLETKLGRLEAYIAKFAALEAALQVAREDLENIGRGIGADGSVNAAKKALARIEEVSR